MEGVSGGGEVVKGVNSWGGGQFRFSPAPVFLQLFHLGCERVDLVFLVGDVVCGLS